MKKVPTIQAPLSHISLHFDFILHRHRPKPQTTKVGCLQVTLASISLNVGHNLSVGSSRSNVLALKVRQETLIRLAESTGRSKSVDLAITSEVGGANLVNASARRSEQLSINGRLNNSIDVLENVALGEDVTTGTDLECVAGVVVPVVVDGVQESVTLDLGATSTGVVDVVALQGDEVGVTIEVDTPVGVGVAGCGVVGNTVDVVVGQTDAVVGGGTKDVVLATDTGSLGLLDGCLFPRLGYRGLGLTVTWSIQIRSASSMVMASPPQTYSGLISVMAMFLYK